MHLEEEDILTKLILLNILIILFQYNLKRNCIKFFTNIFIIFAKIDY